MASERSGLYGMIAEFESPEGLCLATRRVREEGYRFFDAYTPFPVEEAYEAMGEVKDKVALITLIGGLCGGLIGFFMQFYSDVVDYPLNIGGRPMDSWPAFIPVTFELTILFAGLSGVIGMLVLNRLPHPYHPVFNVPAFLKASENRFFLCIQAKDPLFDREQTRGFLENFSPLGVFEVEL